MPLCRASQPLCVAIISPERESHPAAYLLCERPVHKQEAKKALLVYKQGKICDPDCATTTSQGETNSGRLIRTGAIGLLCGDLYCHHCGPGSHTGKLIAARVPGPQAAARQLAKAQKEEPKASLGIHVD